MSNTDYYKVVTVELTCEELGQLYREGRQVCFIVSK